MSDDSLISVIMGVYYKQSDLSNLKRAVESILTQTHSTIELIICQWNSTPDAITYLEDISRSDNRILLIDGYGASLLSEKLNFCLKVAKGKWIARMDDDDYSFPERLEKQLNYLKKHNDVAFVGCNVKLMQDGKESGIQCFPEKPQVNDFLFTMPFIHPALLFRKTTLEVVNGYSQLTRCNKCEDYDLLLRIYEAGMCGANIQTVYFSYTLPPQGITTRNFSDRLNETKTRLVRFKSIKLLPKAFPYAVKPIVLWFLPKKLLARLKLNKLKQDEKHKWVL